MAITSTTGPSVRARTRNRVGAGAEAAPLNPGAVPDWAASGADAIKGYEKHQEVVAQRREERQAEYGVPFRHFVSRGEEVDAIILDNDFGPGLYEHELTMNDRFKRINPKNGRPFDQFVTSPCLFEPDPLTQECGLQPYYATFITVNLLRPYTDSKGNTRSYQRRLVALKGEAMELLATIREQQIKQGHTNAPLRGVHIVFKRGTGEQSLKTGLPMYVERHSEDEIMETFAHPQVLGEKDGKVVKTENEDCFPIDYARAFPKPSAEAIRTRFGLGAGSAAAGSSAYNRGHFNDQPDGGGGYEQAGGFDDTGTDGFNDGTGAGGMSGSSGSLQDDLDDDIPF